MQTTNDIKVHKTINAKHAVENPADCNNGKLSLTIGILSANEYKLEKQDMKHGHNDNTKAILYIIITIKNYYMIILINPNNNIPNKLNDIKPCPNFSK